jgi:hypothetical protein
MKTIEETAMQYDRDREFMLDYYLKEYNRMKMKTDDNHPYMLRLKLLIKELRKKN